MLCLIPWLLRRWCALAVFGVSLTVLRADTVILVPVADATLIEAAPSNSLGGANWITAGTTQNYTRNRALMRFDITNAIPRGSRITLASMRISCTRNPPLGEHPPDSTFTFRRMFRDWGEGSNGSGEESPGLGNPAQDGDATWFQPFFGTTNFWTTPGGAEGIDFSSTSSSSAFVGLMGNDYQIEPTLELIADVQFWLDHPESNFGLLMKTESEGIHFTARRFGSREVADLDIAPELIVDFSPAPTKFPLTVDVQPQNGGSVALNPPQPGDGYDAGTIVTLTANASNGFAFTGWTGAITTTNNPTTVTMDAMKSVTANFSNTTHTLTLVANPTNGGSIEASPLPNGTNGTYVHGTPVTLTATPALGFLFTNFTGGASATTNVITITIDADVSVIANFVEHTTFTLTLVTNPPGSGTIQAMPSPNAPGGTYYENTVVTLTATALRTNDFTNWSGAVSSMSNRVTLLMDANKTATANFVPIVPPAYTLTVSVNPANAGSVLVTPPPAANGTYPADTIVALAAQPDAGFRFLSWSGAVNTTNSLILIAMSGNRSVTANFAPIPSLDFTEARGGYAGLLLDEHEINFATSGFLSLRLSKTGGYRGTATVGGVRQSIAGQFDRFGYAPLFLRRGTLSGSLQIDSADDRITGSLPVGAKSATLLLYRITAGSNAPALAGDYTLAFAAAPPVTDAGITKLRLSADGTARLRGLLGDGTRFTARSFLSSDARIPLFARLYHHRGGVLAWLNVATNGTVQGSARWTRPADSRGQSFPDGFELEVPVQGLFDNN